MMKPISIFCILILALGYQSLLAQSLSIPLDSDPNRSATYHESIRFYQNLRKKYPSYVTIETFGNTDIGIPLHIVTISKRGKDKGKLVTLINNAIHPGEPDGVDAPMILEIHFLEPIKMDLKNMDSGAMQKTLTSIGTSSKWIAKIPSL